MTELARHKNVERGFFTIPEAAHWLGRKESTFKKWIYSGRANSVLFTVTGGKVVQVVLNEEMKRLVKQELPGDGERPNCHAQRLWNRRRDKGRKGAAVRWARYRAKKAAAQDQGTKPKGAYVHHLDLDTSTPESMPAAPEPSLDTDEPKS